MDIKLYNTLSRKIEDFKPIEEGKVKIYSCGPTVYNRSHIGNLSSYVRADVLRRAFEFLGYKVKHVINITDVGHLTSDADTGEDKMEKGAIREGKSAWDVAKEYENLFKEDIKKLNIKNPAVFCRATDHIAEQIEFVKELEKKGFTYQIDDGIYFDTSKLADYGKLAGLDKQEQLAGARVDVNTQKKNPADFALWKFETPGICRQMVWQSPWGERTFPGWHIECSAMGVKYLGDRFDIHTGGTDHIGVHHTNEIAQNEARYGRPVVNYWVHFEHILYNNAKMSKSTGGFITLDDLLDKDLNPLAFRYLVLTANYRHKLNFTWESLETAQKALNSLYAFVRSNKSENGSGKVLENYVLEFKNAISNNLDIPTGLAILWKTVRSSENKSDIYKTMLEFDKVLGLGFDSVKQEEIDEKYIKLAKNMDEARTNKDYEKADKIRNELFEAGFIVKNTKEGSILERK